MLGRILASTSLLVLAACTSNPVLTDFDPAANFASYRTFAFLEPEPVVARPANFNPLIPPRIIDAARRELTAKGLSEASDTSQADLILSFTVGSRDRIDVIDTGPYYGPGPYGWGAPYYGGTETIQYTEGTLSIDMFDRERKVPVWHGRTSRTVTQKMRENPSETINEAIGEILADFPPGQTGS
ncbi:MAG: DUF4136 domain-containing protein [Planctomycetota bacterium]